MTQDEIIEIANKAFDESSFTDAEVLRFAKFIAEKEREACIAHAMTSAEKAIDVAIKLEREACAKVCEDDDSNAGEWHSETHVGGYFAKAIRARVQE